MKMKLYQVRECTNCGDDDRYCEACVGASLAKARPSWDRAINRAAGIGLLLMAAEFVASLLGNTWARSGVVFGAIMIGFWVGAVSDALIAPFKQRKAKAPASPKGRCAGRTTIVDEAGKEVAGSMLGTIKFLGQLWEGNGDLRCANFGDSDCYHDLCAVHCKLMCDDACPNKEEINE